MCSMECLPHSDSDRSDEELVLMPSDSPWFYMEPILLNTAALLFLLGTAMQGGEIKHAIQSRRFQQDDMDSMGLTDSMESVDSMDPE